MDEWPGSLHLAGLEVITEGSEVGVTKEATVRVVGWGCVTGKAALIVAHLGPI